MEPITYLNFDLAIEKIGDAYRVRTSDPSGASATGDFKLPFSDIELENFLLRMGVSRARQTVRRADSPEMTATKTFGAKLFNAVFNGDVRGRLDSSVDEAERRDVRLRIRLRLNAAPELLDLPWEYLYNPSLNRFLALSTRTPLVRYLELPESVRPLTVKPPLKVLVMISSPSDREPLEVEREWANLNLALAYRIGQGYVSLKRADKATLAALQQEMRRDEYHIFHFIGHGGFDTRVQDGVLVLENDMGGGHLVSGQDMGVILHDYRHLRLAVLNACEGARTSLTDPFAGAAQTLVQQGLSAVIAMQFEVSDEAAITFAREFYGAVSDGYPIDAALGESRKAIFSQGNQTEWGTPVLYLRASDGSIFNVEPQSDAERQGSRESDLLSQQALAALEKADWPTAIARYEALLALHPDDRVFANQFDEAKRQQSLAERYAAGLAHLDAGRWSDAVTVLGSLSALVPGYKDVDTLSAEARRQLGLLTAQRKREQELSRLYADALAAIDKQDWQSATSKLQDVLKLDPAHAEAAARLEEVRLHEIEGLKSDAQAAKQQEDWPRAVQSMRTLLSRNPSDSDAALQLSEVRRQQELAAVYTRACDLLDAGRWAEALESLHQIENTQNNYKDVDQLLVRAQQALEANKSTSPPTTMPRITKERVAPSETATPLAPKQNATSVPPVVNRAGGKTGVPPLQRVEGGQPSEASPAPMVARLFAMLASVDWLHMAGMILKVTIRGLLWLVPLLALLFLLTLVFASIEVVGCRFRPMDASAANYQCIDNPDLARVLEQGVIVSPTFAHSILRFSPFTFIADPIVQFVLVLMSALRR
jgi:outer membrane protein assembly factor BamD (BamD/ComL family)